jgi:hypothetical protein
VRGQCRGRYGDLATGYEWKTVRLTTAVGLEREHNLNVVARILLNGDLMFCPACDLELDVAKKPARQLLRDELYDNGHPGAANTTAPRA